MSHISLCPLCHRPAQPRPGNRAFPFCSDRCRLLDLSKWLGGDYRIAGRAMGDGDGEESAQAAPGSEDDG